MSFLRGLIGLLKILSLIILILAIAIPIRYGSIDRRYLSFRLLHSMLSLKYTFISDADRPKLSADYRALETILRMKPIAHRNPQLDALTVVKELRLSFAGNTFVLKPSHCQINKEIFEHDGHKIDAYWITNPPKDSPKTDEKILIYLHGGGYILGDINSYGGIECHYSKIFNVSILHVEYRLSPEHPLPAAVEDTIAIYRALIRDKISPSQIILMGDSAGGGLSLLTIQSFINHQLPVPRGVIALSPWTDLSISGESYTRNEKVDAMLSTDDTKWVTSHVLGPNHSQLSADSPTYSPLFGSFKGFPPMYINVGTAEILEDDSRRVVNKAREAGVDVTFEEGLHLMHVYPMFFDYYPEARASLNNINQWIQKIFTNN